MKSAGVRLKKSFLLLLLLIFLFGALAKASVFAGAANLPGSLGIDLIAGADFVPGEVLAPADSWQKAQEIARDYGLELKSYAWGIAVLAAADPEQLVPQSNLLNDLVSNLAGRAIREKLGFNLIYQLDEAVSFDQASTYQNGAAPELAVAYDTAAQWHHGEIDSESAWPTSLGGGVTVAVIDSGIDTTHPKFAGKILGISYNSYTDRIGTAYVKDDQGHGTHVSGIIAASMNGDPSVCGIAPQAQILVIKANITSTNSFDLTSLLRGLNYAVANGADIINMSLGRGFYYGEDELEHNALCDAVANGVTIVCSAGNDSNSHAGYPAAYPETIAVSAVRQGGIFDSDYSNYGPEIDLAAPGTAVYSTKNGGGYLNMTGTSMASPCVAGVAALVKSLHPEYTPEQVRAALCQTAKVKDIWGKNRYYGWGIVNAYGALLGADSLYNASYDFNDDERLPLTVKVIPGHKLIKPENQKREGYAFKGWYTAKEGGEDFDFETIIGADIKLYAQWIETAPGMYFREFPDPLFRLEVLQLIGGGIKESDLISADDLVKLGAITDLDLNNKGLSDLTGLQYFSGLTYLDCRNNRLTGLDITNNPRLTTLYCSHNYLLSEAGIIGLEAIKDRLDLYSFDPQYPVIQIISQPPPQTTVMRGSDLSIEIEVAATQGATLTYQWYRSSYPTNGSGAVIVDATFPKFSVPTITANEYYYHCFLVVSNSLGTVTMESEVATVLVTADLLNALPPEITAHPLSANLVVNAAHTLSVEANSLDGGNLSYQWYGNTVNDTGGAVAIAGATDPGYAPPTATLGVSYYYVVVKNSNDEAIESKDAVTTSKIAAVTVKAPFVAVTDIYGPVTDAIAGNPVTLRGVVLPANASNKEIAWNIKDDGGAGAIIEGDIFQTASDGAVVVTATVEGGIREDSIIMLAPGPYQSHILKSDGSIWGWGYNWYSQMGDGTNIDHNTPIQVSPDYDWTAVSGGDGYVMALKSDGSLWGWGRNIYGNLGDGTTTTRRFPVRIGTDKDWAAVAASYNHTVALKKDGSLWVWGSSRLGNDTSPKYLFPVRVGTDQDWTAIATGRNYIVALKSDGSLWAWGKNDYGQLGDGTNMECLFPTQVGVDKDWIAISARYYHNMALKKDGSLWAWGNNGSGALGDGTITNRYLPTRVGSDNDWIAMAAGGSYSMAIKGNGSLWAWGVNTYGELGIDSTTTIRSPIQVGANRDWVAIAVGFSFTLALKRDGSLWAWGRNQHGQVGDGTITDRYSPVPILDTSNFAKDFVITVIDINAKPPQINTQPMDATVIIGASHTLEVAATSIDGGTLSYQWYTNTAASLLGATAIPGATGNAYTPPTDTEGIYYYYVIVINTNNDSIGSKTTSVASQIAIFKVFAPVTDIIEVPESAVSKRPLLLSGTVLPDFATNKEISWSLKDGGSTGAVIVGDILNTTAAGTVVVTAAIEDGLTEGSIAALATGSSHNIALKKDGSLWAWGNNSSSGKLGDGTVTNRSVPTRIGIDKDWSVIAAGKNHTIALKKDGGLWAWGNNSSGQLGDGTTTDIRVPTRVVTEKDWFKIAASNNHTIALKKDGSLWAWGLNSSGQLGDDTILQRKVPTRVGIDKDWAIISAGSSHNLALKKDGSLWAWGNNGSGKLGDGTTTTRKVPTRVGTDKDWAMIEAASSFSIALKSDGSLWTWGSNMNGLLGDGSTIDRYVPTQVGTDKDWASFVTGDSHVLALKNNGSLWAWGLNFYGELFDGTTNNSRFPVQAGMERSWAAVVTGNSHSIGLKKDGSLWACGYNSFGQLGDGTTSSRKIPVQIIAATNFTKDFVIEVADPLPGVRISGQIRSYNPNNSPAIRLIQDDEELDQPIVGLPKGAGLLEQEFCFEAVSPGRYDLVITKDAHTKFTLKNLLVGEEDLDLASSSRPELQLMTLRCGDINGDGLINDADLTVLWRAGNYNRKANEAENPECDLNGDGLINDADLTILWQAYNYNRGEVVL